MANRLVVSTRCPTCDAPLDFSEGSNAIQCRFCQSNLLVTGRKQTLSYYIPPKLDIHRAVVKVSSAHKAKGKPCRIVQPQLYFIPYYRLTGHDLRWEEELSEKETRRLPQQPNPMYYNIDHLFHRSTGGLMAAFELAGNLIGHMFETHTESIPPSSSPLSDPGPAGSKPKTKSLSAATHRYAKRPDTGFSDNNIKASFRDRYVEKNFVACDLQGYGMYSLGVRPNILRLELFQNNTVESLGKIVAMDITPDKAFMHAMKTARSQPLLYRRVLGQVLSIIYFPFWVVEVKREGKQLLTIVDAISQTVVKLEAPTELYQTLNRPLRMTSQSIGFRPLVCPNCGWDLPVRTNDVIFFCSSCRKAWQIYGNHLYEVNYQIANVPAVTGDVPVKYLPVWILQAVIKNDPSARFMLPAFRFTRLKALKDLSMVLSNQPHDYLPLSGKIPELHGCFYDQEDAVKLAQLTYVGSSSKYKEALRIMEDKQFKISGLTLTWFPFKQRGLSLIDPFTGFPILRNLLQ
jgi:DNA-directed RNA polymerase subunit RPC12/RpoP/predicted RNA-binding Zn-ribbon protein involved in translation (DUF1610 family)